MRFKAEAPSSAHRCKTFLANHLGLFVYIAPLPSHGKLRSVKVKVINTLPEVHEAEGPRKSTKFSYQSENILDCITIKRPHNAHPLINS